MAGKTLDVGTQLDAMAILAREAPLKGSRRFWMNELDALGRLLAPDLPPTKQRAVALEDRRGHAFVEALQQCPR